MTDKFKKAWEEIEDAIGGCCLHKKAAYLEVAGEPVQCLTLVTSAPASAIEAFIGARKVNKSQNNRYAFSHNGINVELTTLCNIEDIDELHEKAFRHTLTIDSIGVRRDGRVSDAYNGVSDYHNHIVRLSDERAVISEILFRRILLLVIDDGFSLDESIRTRFDTAKIFEKESYRKKYCEVLLSLLNGPECDWNKVATALDILGGALGHRKAIVNYTKSLKDCSPEFKTTFAFLVFALIKVTAKELQPLIKGEPKVNYFDSLCTNLQKPISSQADFMERKEKYGPEFLETLFDMQELWMAIEGIPYKRPSERDFDKMALLISDERFWKTPNKKDEAKTVSAENNTDVNNTVEDENDILDEQYDIEGTIDIGYLTGDYHDEDYDEPSEGKVTDDYLVEEERKNSAEQNNSMRDLLDILDEENLDEVPKVSGINADALGEYEAKMRGEASSPAPASREKRVRVFSIINAGM